MRNKLFEFRNNLILMPADVFKQTYNNPSALRGLIQEFETPGSVEQGKNYRAALFALHIEKWPCNGQSFHFPVNYDNNNTKNNAIPPFGRQDKHLEKLLFLLEHGASTEAFHATSASPYPLNQSIQDLSRRNGSDSTINELLNQAAQLIRTINQNRSKLGVAAVIQYYKQQNPKVQAPPKSLLLMRNKNVLLNNKEWSNKPKPHEENFKTR